MTDDELIEAAGIRYGSDNIEIGSPTDALFKPDGTIEMFSRGDEGAWVRAWVWVPYPDSEDDDDDDEENV